MAVLISISSSLQAQSGLDNPLGNSIIQHESNPIDLATGLPYITVPLFNLPTIADDVAINMALGYHPSSVAVNREFSGNCGRGWSIPTGGVIVGEHSVQRADWQSSPTTNARAYFNYSFMGYSGKFYVEKASNKLQGYIAENKNNVLLIDIAHNALTYKISSFTLYDTKGYKYVFQTADSYTKTTGGISAAENYMFQLTQIKDNNDATLATFNYKTYGTTKINNLVQSIVTHHGKVELENSLGTSTTYSPYVRYTKMTVSDFKNSFIRRFDFQYGGDKLSQVDESNLLQTELLSHKFYYKEDVAPAPYTGMDEWGYQNSSSGECFNPTHVSPGAVTNGILQKISLPSGGAVVYEFESNTFSYSIDNRPIDQNSLFVTDPNFFTTFNYKNLHNFQRTPIASASFSSSSTSVTFTITVAQKAYFKVYGSAYNNPAAQGGGIAYPNFRLQKGGVTQATFGVNSICDNSGMGATRDLTPGTYTLTMTSTAPTTGSVVIDGYTPIAVAKKWHHGNGVRIKKIGHFESDVVNQRYYELISLPFPNPTNPPIRETSYDYNLLDDPQRSSGSIYYVNASTEEKPALIYKNVTVTESGNMGRTAYTFYSPLDYYQLPESEYYEQVPNFAKIKQLKVFKEGSATPLREKNFVYNSVIVGTYNNYPLAQLKFQLSSSLPAEIREKDYSNGTIETVSTFDYDSYRKLANSKQFTNATGDLIHKKYFYNWLNAATSKNRRVLEKIETYRNTDLLFTDQINYGNSWTAIAEPGSRPNTLLPPYPNVSYLPLSLQNSKGSEGLVTERRFNLYDGYSRLWESEKENGRRTVYIWGYNHTQIIAKIENASHSAIPQSLISAMVNASNNALALGESLLKTAQDDLRANASLANAMITTYTYRPLIGISSVTDEKKQTIQYFYDNHNRLKQVKDASGRILTENEYNYRTQN